MYHPILIYKLIKFTLRIEVYIMLYKIKIKKKGEKIIGSTRNKNDNKV